MAEQLPIGVALTADKLRLELELSQVAASSVLWTARMARRVRWVQDEQARNEFEEEALADLVSLVGCQKSATEFLEAVSHSSLIQVSISIPDDAPKDFANHVLRMPWESFLALATSKERMHRPLIVIRHYQTDERSEERLDGRSQDPGGPNAAYVQCSPEPVARRFSFASERLVARLAFEPGKFRQLINPDLEELGAVGASRPLLVHCAGADVSQMLISLLRHGEFKDQLRQHASQKHLLLRKKNGASDIAIVDPEQFADAIVREHVPAVVCLNFYHSSWSYAPALIRRGVSHVIGLHGEVDDELAEMFFSEFYRHWTNPGVTCSDAFCRAWLYVHRELREAVAGTGLVLWSSVDVAANPERVTTLQYLARQPLHSHPVQRSVDSGAVVGDPGEVYFDVSVFPRLNYAATQMSGTPFRRLRVLIPRLPENTVASLHLSVALRDGDTALPFELSRRITGAVTELSGVISIPLVSPLLRSRLRKEPVRTTLTVKMSVGAASYCRSFPVELSPINEWNFGGTLTGDVLPSYVLPNDPAVAATVGAATPILRALKDNPTVGFSGYQQSNQQGEAADRQSDEQREAGERNWAIDQAKALWHQLAGDSPLSYISAAPGSLLGRQRLRTPTDVTSTGHGTCVDLCLLMCACLEYIRLKPVIVLYQEHAVCGFWTSSEAYREFVLAPSGARHKVNAPQSRSWVIQGDLLRDLQELVKPAPISQGSSEFLPPALYLMEMNLMANQEGVSDSNETAVRDFGKRLREALDGQPSHVRAVLDIAKARTGGVTPLPVGEY